VTPQQRTWAESEKETAARELTGIGIAGSHSLDNGGDDNEAGAGGHSHLTIPGISGRANERNGDHGADLAHGGHDTSLMPLFRTLKEALSSLISRSELRDRSSSLQRGAEKPNHAREIQGEGS
jgi:hypothetical protein